MSQVLCVPRTLSVFIRVIPYADSAVWAVNDRFKNRVRRQEKSEHFKFSSV